MSWWIWVIMGAALVVVELATPGVFIFLFFGVAAIIVGGLTAFGFVNEEWLRLTLFAVLSVVLLVAFRKRLQARVDASTGKSDHVDSMVGTFAILTEDVAPGATGKAESRGTSWVIRNGGTTPLHKGQRCRVQRVEGLTLWVVAE